MRKIILLILVLIIAGCAAYYPQNEYQFVKVLGITPEGDTILIDVNSLRPKVYNNYYYDQNNRYPYNNYFYNPPVIIKPPSNKPNRPIIWPNNNKPIKPNKNPR